MANGTGRTRLLTFKTELERLMIAYRIEGGELKWNQEDVQARDALVRWAESYDRAGGMAFSGSVPRRHTTVIDASEVTARSGDGSTPAERG